jgi:hypothetical protein
MGKLEIARKIFGEMQGARRKDIITAFVEKAGMTKASASTFHYNLSKKNGVVVHKKKQAKDFKPQLRAILQESTGSFVVSIYNSMPNVKPVTKFATKADCVERVMKLASANSEVEQNLVDRLIPIGM